MFKREDGWIFGTYFAFTIDNFSDEYFLYDEEKILNTLRNSDSRMTENITPLILTSNNRTIHFEPLSVLDPTGIYQKIDMHSNDKLNWCVPVCDKDSDTMYLFIYNNGGEYKVDCINGEKHNQVNIKDKGVWSLIPIGNLSSTDEIVIIINNVIEKKIKIIEENKQNFKKHNFIEFK
jgi:hypothetical protein